MAKIVSKLLFYLIILRTVLSALPQVCPEIITKARWGGRTPSQVEYAIFPIEYVVVHHTVTEGCDSETSCSSLVSSIQNFHKDELKYDDIGYNFLVGGDGRIYEGVGWHKVGAHTLGYNRRSLGLAFIGTFSEAKPEAKQLNAAKKLLQCGVELGELDKRYKIFGARQVGATQSPGLELYHEIQTWVHFSRSPS